MKHHRVGSGRADKERGEDRESCNGGLGPGKEAKHYLGVGEGRARTQLHPSRQYVVSNATRRPGNRTYQGGEFFGKGVIRVSSHTCSVNWVASDFRPQNLIYRWGKGSYAGKRNTLVFCIHGLTEYRKLKKCRKPRMVVP